MTISNFFLVFVGGGLGAAVRFFVTTAAARWGAFPFGTLAVNAGGSFLMGLVMGAILLLTEKYGLIAESLRLLLAVGFLGGLTTFSSFSFETLLLLKGGSYLLAFCNIALQLLVGLLFAALGMALAKALLS
jgi:CrcB-like protein